MAGKQFFVRFWGVRGSYPVPGQKSVRYGGNTSCVEVRAGNHIIILDAGTGIINLGEKLVEEFAGRRHVVNLIFSHTHHDHIIGLPYFAPTFNGDCKLNIFGQKMLSQNIEEILSCYLTPQYSPVELDELSSDLSLMNINENQVLFFHKDAEEPELIAKSELTLPSPDNTVLSLMRNYAHPKIGTFIIKIEYNGKSIVYATDTEGYVGGDARLTRFAQGVNLLVHDAQYTPEQYPETQGFGHSTYEMAAQVAEAAKVEHLVLFHHDPTYDDDKLVAMEAKAKQLFPNAIMGKEGLEFNL